MSGKRSGPVQEAGAVQGDSWKSTTVLNDSAQQPPGWEIAHLQLSRHSFNEQPEALSACTLFDVCSSTLVMCSRSRTLATLLGLALRAAFSLLPIGSSVSARAHHNNTCLLLRWCVRILVRLAARALIRSVPSGARGLVCLTLGWRGRRLRLVQLLEADWRAKEAAAEKQSALLLSSMVDTAPNMVALYQVPHVPKHQQRAPPGGNLRRAVDAARCSAVRCPECIPKASVFRVERAPNALVQPVAASADTNGSMVVSRCLSERGGESRALSLVPSSVGDGSLARSVCPNITRVGTKCCCHSFALYYEFRGSAVVPACKLPDGSRASVVLGVQCLRTPIHQTCKASRAGTVIQK